MNQVEIHANGKSILTYALFDPASVLTAVKPWIANKLSLEGKKTRMVIGTAIGRSQPEWVTRVNFQVSSVERDVFYNIQRVCIMDKFNLSQPSYDVGNLVSD